MILSVYNMIAAAIFCELSYHDIDVFGKVHHYNVLETG
jgi:hypothetical protein